MLLSSYFVYNSMGSIDENALSGLSFVTQISRHIAGKMGNNAQASEEDISQFMPKFMWVVRDFSLQLVDEAGN